MIPPDQEIYEVEKRIAERRHRVEAVARQSGRAALKTLCEFGLVDTFRKHHPEAGRYSWWDYRMLAFPKNDGLRLDLVLATEPVARSCTEASLDRNERKGKLASDHVPALATLGEL